MKIGIPKEYFVEGMQPEVDAVIKEAIKQLEALGATVEWGVSLPRRRTPWRFTTSSPRRRLRRTWRATTAQIRLLYLNTDNMWEGMEKTKQFGFGPESETPHHARQLCPVVRLLRCLLSESAESAHADPP